MLASLSEMPDDCVFHRPSLCATCSIKHFPGKGKNLHKVIPLKGKFPWKIGVNGRDISGTQVIHLVSSLSCWEWILFISVFHLNAEMFFFCIHLCEITFYAPFPVPSMVLLDQECYSEQYLLSPLSWGHLSRENTAMNSHLFPILPLLLFL